MAGESLRAYDRRLSLHLMLQPYLANQLFKDPVINGQGILGRCLISWPERLAGQRLYKAIDLTRDAKVHAANSESPPCCKCPGRVTRMDHSIPPRWN